MAVLAGNVNAERASGSEDTAASSNAMLAGRMDRLPACATTWRPAMLVSLAAIFEVYDLYQTAYIPPGLIRSGIFNASGGVFGISDQAMFASVTFLGLFVGATFFTPIVDRLGRRPVFVYALLAYSAATAFTALQTTSLGVFAGRFPAGVGLGLELVTIDAYLIELTPAHMRGRAFAANHAIQFLAVPILAFMSWLLIPRDPLGYAGWRWVMMAGALGALIVWVLRRRLPESPRWLTLNGRDEEAELIVAAIEGEVFRRTGRALPPANLGVVEISRRVGLAELWRAPYRRRTVMLCVFNFFQTIGFFGFSNWLPSLLMAQGHDISHSLFYSFCIAWAYPLTPLLWGLTVAERFERKWLIVASAIGVATAGALFAVATNESMLVVLGITIAGFATLLSMSYHPYQAELFPTEIRARAIGFVYSFSRLSTALTSFMIGFALTKYGTPGVFTLITISMAVVVVSIGAFGPRTRGVSLEKITC